jgi:hypothetical protein
LQAFSGVVSPGDVAFYDLREDLGYGQRARCRPALLGRALSQGLTRQQFRRLLANVPNAWVSYLRQADACFRRKLPRGRCVRAAAVVEPPGAGKSSGTSEPFVP